MCALQEHYSDLLFSGWEKGMTAELAEECFSEGGALAPEAEVVAFCSGLHWVWSILLSRVWGTPNGLIKEKALIEHPLLLMSVFKTNSVHFSVRNSSISSNILSVCHWGDTTMLKTRRFLISHEYLIPGYDTFQGRQVLWGTSLPLALAWGSLDWACCGSAPQLH